jgi:hypothetical protein
MKYFPWAIAGVAIVLLILVGLRDESQPPAPTVSSSTSPILTAKAAPNNPVANSASILGEKSKCATDGAAYVRSYEINNNKSNSYGSPLWYDPEYHYSAKLDTCLAYVGYGQEYSQYTDIWTQNMKTYLFIENYVFDVYSNKVILYSVINRESENGQNNDSLVDYSALYPDLQNLYQPEFFSQKAQLMRS